MTSNSPSLSLAQAQTLEPGIYHNVPAVAYKAINALNQSTLKKFGRANSPAHYWDEITRPGEEPDHDYLRIGSMIDDIILRPGFDLSTAYRIWEGKTRKGNAWDAFKEEATDARMTIMTPKEVERAKGAVNALLYHEDINKWIKASRKQVVVVVDHPVLKCRCKAMIDLLPEPKYEWAGDLKSGYSATPAEFTDQAFDKGYDIQAGWYMKLLELAGHQVNNFAFIVVESKRHHGCRVFTFERDSPEIEKAYERVMGYATKYLECVKAGVWPSYPKTYVPIKFKPWQLRGEREFESY